MLCDGRLLRLGSPEEAITSESLRLVYGVDVDVMVLDRAGGSAARLRARPSRDLAVRVGPRVKAWVVFGDHLKFGEGRARLLEAIDRCGSLKRAVEQFAMSYRNAWGYLRELESAAGFKFLERAPGRRPGGGMRLTPRGRQFLTQYWEFHRAIEAAAQHGFPRAFRAVASAGRDSQPARPGSVARRTR